MSKKQKIKTLRPPRKGPEFILLYRRRAGATDTRKKRISDVAAGRSRKPKNAREATDMLDPR